MGSHVGGTVADIILSTKTVRSLCMHVADWIRYSRPATSETATLGIQHTELYLLVGLTMRAIRIGLVWSRFYLFY